MTQVSIPLYIVTAIWEFIKESWPVLGPLVGVLAGAGLTSRIQRKHWIADRKLQEYQELTTAVTRGFNGLLHQAEPIRAYSLEEQRTQAETEEEVLITISDRIFIADEVEGLKVQDRWIKARQSFRQLHVRKDLWESIGAIKADLITQARKLMK
jgi:hypothetical protein